jgi:hypothetical protein
MFTVIILVIALILSWVLLNQTKDMPMTEPLYLPLRIGALLIPFIGVGIIFLVAYFKRNN